MLAVAFYLAGAFLIPKTNTEYLKEKGIANQEEYTYTDSEGEEHEGESYIDIKGIGKILTYKDVYFSSIGMLFVALILCRILFGEDEYAEHEMKCMIFANCIIGVLLIWMTSKETVVSTILFWFGIITAYITDTKVVNKEG